MVIWLALWVLHLAFVCSLITRVCPAFHTRSDGKLSGAWERGYFTLVLCFVITNSVWLTSAHVASNGATYCGSHGRGSGQETDHESNVTWFWNGTSISTFTQWRSKVGPGRVGARPEHHVRPTHVTRSCAMHAQALACARPIPMTWLCHCFHSLFLRTSPT